MKKHPDTVDVRIGLKMIDARRVKRARPANDPVNFVALLEQEIREITSVLTGDTGNKRFFHERRFALKQGVCASNLFSFQAEKP